MTNSKSASDKAASDRAKPKKNTFKVDIEAIRARAGSHLEKGALTEDYALDVEAVIEVLQQTLASEIVCVLRYTMHSIAVSGINSQSVAAEFKQHAKEEQEHAEMIAERIDQLGGTPNFNPEGLTTRAITDYGNAETMVDMIRENLVGERLVIEFYRDLVQFFGDADPTSCTMIKHILAEEEEHAADMHDLLVAHQGRPFLKE